MITNEEGLKMVNETRYLIEIKHQRKNLEWTVDMLRGNVQKMQFTVEGRVGGRML